MSEPAIKAMVLRQPWAALVVTGAKDIENRTWTTKYRGPLAIVAGAARDRKAHDAGELEPDPIEVHHDPVGIDGSCIRVR